MPTYEYRCSNGHEFEQFPRMSEDPLKECTVCGAPAERLLSSGAGLIFKGSGFYITDYRGDSYKKAAEADKAPSAPSESAPAAPAKKDGGSSSSGSSSSSPKGE